MVSPEERIRRCHSKLRTVSVTGTNGKSTTTSMLACIVQASDEPYAKMTTLGADVNGKEIQETRALYRFLETVEGAVSCGVQTMALEVTSKALSQGFAQRWPAHVAVFTNLSRDHLDMHKSPEAYLASKAQLFMHLHAEGIAILNADDPSSALIEMVLPEDARVLWYSLSGKAADLSVQKISVSLEGTHLIFHQSPASEFLGSELRLSVVGDVHGANGMAAALAAKALGYSSKAIKEGLNRFQTLAGRFDIISQQPLIVVDYAHTPDGLKGTLRTARPLCAGKLICVFGCGGERDRGKRPQMGTIADQYADIIILTTDNPRRENPDQIAKEIMKGRKGQARWFIQHNRRTAIAFALEMASPEDVVIIAGKGHEKEQIIGTKTMPFCDVETVRALL